MYEHYERHRTDNLTDPALRRVHPISTISGWDRERDGNASPSDAHPPVAALTNGNGNGGVTPSPPPAKISKSEQTDDAEMADAKCVCTEPTEDATNAESKTIDASGDSGDSSTEPPAKPISSISSISQVYNEQLCNGNGHAGASEDDDSMSSPKKPTSGPEALRETLELAEEDIDVDAKIADDNKEIVEEIVEEILKKSEDLLDECKRTLDADTENAASSSVIKDEEIEHAVSEVVKGVREIEKMTAATSTANKQETVDVAVTEDEVKRDETIKIATIDETCQTRNDNNQKTDLVLSSSAPAGGDESTTESAATTTNDDDDEDDDDVVVEDDEEDNIEEIVTNIVNEVIDNCVNQTLSTHDTDASPCDNNDSDRTSSITIQNDDSINNNVDESTDVMAPTTVTATPTITETATTASNTTNDRNDNAIIAESSTPSPTIPAQTSDVVEVDTMLSDAISATTLDDTAEETSEQIVTSIVNEIVDTCVRNVGDDNNNREATETPTAQHKDADDEDDASDEICDEAVNRTLNTSISTSTQVENNHFGKCVCVVPLSCCRQSII